MGLVETRCAECGSLEATHTDHVFAPPSQPPDTQAELDSPDFVPPAGTEFAARGYERRNRHEPSDTQAGGCEDGHQWWSVEAGAMACVRCGVSKPPKDIGGGGEAVCDVSALLKRVRAADDEEALRDINNEIGAVAAHYILLPTVEAKGAGGPLLPSAAAELRMPKEWAAKTVGTFVRDCLHWQDPIPEAQREAIEHNVLTLVGLFASLPPSQAEKADGHDDAWRLALFNREG